ncbi:MAG: DNA repair protein RadA [Candidatus Hydrogenedentota bacterium]|nr:MAG: DNA repair protein RadA [Candidatus Hydrogenedentota bacterium]
MSAEIATYVAKKNQKPVFICTHCEYSTVKWMGQCPGCGKWNTLEERILSSTPSRKIRSSIKPASITEKEKSDSITRLSSKMKEFDKLLGGGIVPGSVILLAGDPGVGKSTFLLALAKSGYRCLYVSGEESLSQVQDRAKRVGAMLPTVLFLHETSLETILAVIEKEKPDLVFIDSIQTVYSGEARGFAGSVSQIRDAAGMFLELAKRMNIPFVLTGHITKEGQIAGPRLLEHAVDVVLYFEHEKKGPYRFIRAIKNRFGATGEIAVFQMTSSGLQEIPPNKTLVNITESGGIGSILFPQMEGSRVLLHEIQALVTPTGFANGRRVGENIDLSRIHLIAAILEKYMSMRLSECDIFIRVRGGTPLKDPAADLALLLAMASSFLEKPIPAAVAAFGEVSLSGDIRPASETKERLKALLAYKIQKVFVGSKAEASPYPDQAIRVLQTLNEIPAALGS